MNLELRKKTLTALGWRRGIGNCFNLEGRQLGWHHPICLCLDDGDEEPGCVCYQGDEPIDCKYGPDECGHRHQNTCLDGEGPPIELDPGLAITTLDEWCRKQDSRAWQVSSSVHRKGYTCAIWSKEPTIFLDGATIAEAICLAIIQAHEKGQT